MSREVVGKDMVKWYHKPAVVFIAIIGFGPFAIPLIWASPIINKWQKILLTLLTIILTVWIAKSAVVIYRQLLDQMRDLQAALN